MKKKNIYMLLILILISTISCEHEKIKSLHFNSKIDSLYSKKEIERFIRTKDSSIAKFELKNISDFNRNGRFKITDSIIKRISKEKEINKSFYKYDIDNNGYTDLLIIGNANNFWRDRTQNFDCFVLMNFPNDSIHTVDLIKSRFPPLLVPELKIMNNETIFIVHSLKLNEYTKFSTDTLVYKYGSFIEVNKSPIIHKIEKIKFKKMSDSIYEIIIDKNKKGIFKANYYTKIGDKWNVTKKIFETVISDKKYDEIINIINYIDFENLKENYSVNWTCDLAYELEITYNNGKKKKINDYGMIGSYGLIQTYNLLNDLQFNQKLE